MKIATRAYLGHALRFNAAEVRAKETVLPKIPRRIIDVHSHLGLPEDVEGVDAALYPSRYMHFTHEEHLQVRSALWLPHVELLQIAFCFPFRGVNIRQGNRYVQAIARRDSTFVPFLTGDPCDLASTLQELETGLWRGLNMYAEQLARPAQALTDFLPHPLLEVVEALQIPLILHLPDNLLPDYPDLLKLAARHPQLPIVVAHFGIARSDLEQIEQALQATASCPTIFYDTSWFKDVRVLQAGLDILGPERILYATDQPFNLLRAQFAQHLLPGERYPYHWADSQKPQLYRDRTGVQVERLPNFHYASLAALIVAIEAKYPQKARRTAVIDQVFYQNARRLLTLISAAHEPASLVSKHSSAATLPVLQIPLGEQLCLRVHEERFAAEYYAAIQRDRPYLREWLPWLDEEQSVEDTRIYIRAILARHAQNQGFHCAIWYEERIVGSIGYQHLDRQNRKVELGYWLGSAYQGRGIATRACRALVSYAFEQLGLNKVEIRCATGNRRSCAVAERLGFVREGVIRDEEWLYDHFVDRVVYGMRASEWQVCRDA
ncbi:MAG TPA: GNAT family N-acetyltransferase [Ktedonobacteraceae bacterium]|jgi:ribosomal-protein-serine acetyltransferase